MASDDNFSPYVSTTMASILKNTKSFISFYILDGGISDKNKQKIKNLKKHFKNFEIEFLNVNIDEYFKDLPELECISKSMYSRFLIPKIKPELNKVIYTDCDVVFEKDIKELYEINLENYTIGAVSSYRYKECANFYKETRERLELSYEHKNFMSGLLVINSIKWNNESTTENLLIFAKKMSLNNLLKLPDQDVLNKYFDNNYKPIDKKWCIIPKALSANFNKDEIKEIIKNQAIVHFAGGAQFKPWNNKKVAGAKYFWKYVKYSDFKKEIKKNYIKFNNKNSFFENIFSLKTKFYNDGKRKILTIFGIKIKLKKQFSLRNQMMVPLYPVEINKLISPKDKILIIAPHPDDEVIACGGVIAKYKNQVDVLCINSSGVKYEWNVETADEIAQLRCDEFYEVMKKAGANKSYIAKIGGVPPMFKQINSNFENYLKHFDFREYDFIFTPHKFDGHREHRFVGNYLTKKLIKKSGYKKSLKIVRYEVWGALSNPNYYEDITDFKDAKQSLIDAYISRKKGNYAQRALALNNYRAIIPYLTYNEKYAEAFFVQSIENYLKEKDDKSWMKPTLYKG